MLQTCQRGQQRQEAAASSASQGPTRQQRKAGSLRMSADLAECSTQRWAAGWGGTAGWKVPDDRAAGCCASLSLTV